MTGYYLYQLVVIVISFVSTFAATALGVYIGMKWYNSKKKEK